MHTVELLEQAIARASERGFIVRQDWLNGSAAGVCEFKGRRWLFLDLAQSPLEQLEVVLAAFGQSSQSVQAPVVAQLPVSTSLRKAA